MFTIGGQTGGRIGMKFGTEVGIHRGVVLTKEFFRLGYPEARGVAPKFAPCPYSLLGASERKVDYNKVVEHPQYSGYRHQNFQDWTTGSQDTGGPKRGFWGSLQPFLYIWEKSLLK